MGKGLGIASLVTGILAFIPPFTIIGWILATVAIITGIMGRKKKEGRTLSTIGMWIGIIWWVIFIILAVLSAILAAIFGLLTSSI